MAEEENTIDVLMDRIDLTITEGKVPNKKDIDAVIAYQRKMRAMSEQGIKPKKASAGKTVGLTLAQLGISDAPAKPVVTMKRRL